jgi:hypothetical protein
VDTLLILVIFGLGALLMLAALGVVAFLGGKLVGWLVVCATRTHPRSAQFARFSRRVTYVAFTVFTLYQTYFAIYPPDDFYFGEFEEATLRKPPQDAVVLAKDASYPDFHGDYCSFSRIRFTRASYLKLLEDMSADKRLVGEDGGGFTSSGMPKLNIQPLKIIRTFRRTDLEADHHHSVHFLEDGAQVDVQICVT